MATPWDRASTAYLEEWVPRFVPYHLDLVHELALKPGDRVLVTCAGPGSEVLAAARAVGDDGYVRATDQNGEMVRVCADQVKKAGLATRIECAVADASDVSGGPWNAIVCAFGLGQIAERASVLRAWKGALVPNGKIGVITWGPDDPQQPLERLHKALFELEPQVLIPPSRVQTTREGMTRMFEEAGLVMVRHTVVRHTLSFRRAEDFVHALSEACTWRKVFEELGDARMEKVAARFYETTEGPDAPLSFQPSATLAIAGLPGAEVELEHRPSVRVPNMG